MGLLTKNMVYRRLGHGGMSINKQVQSIPAESARSEPAPTLAERLRIARGRQSQAAFAASLGVHKNSIGSYESGKTKPDSEFLARVCGVCGVSPDWLLLGEGPYRREESPASVELTESGPAADKAEAGPAVMFVPVTGLAHCGIEGWYNPSPLALSVSVPPHYSRQGDMLAVIAVGNSMIPDGIREGYVVMCDCGREPARDDAVFVEKLNGSASIKRYVDRDEEWLYLQGWLKPNERGEQLPYSDQLRLDSIKRMAPVVFVQRRG